VAALAAAALFAARLLGRAGVLTIHVRVPAAGRLRELAQRIIDRICMRLADAIVAVSPPVAASISRAQATVILNGVDLDLFRPSPQDRIRVRRSLGIGPEKAIVFSGRWSRTKGLDTLFTAFQNSVSKGTGLHLLVIGEPAPDEPPIRPEAFFDPVTLRHVHVLGRLKDSKDVAALLNAADAFVLPSLSEGMPLALLEALACGLPVILSDIPIHRELTLTHDCGWLSIPGDVADLARVLEAFSRRAPEPERSARSREAAVQHHSLRTMAGAYRAVYEHALAGRSVNPFSSDRLHARGSDPC